MSVLRRFHEDEVGAPELSTILLIAFIVIPLVALLIIFSDKIAEKSTELWEDLFQKGGRTYQGPR